MEEDTPTSISQNYGAGGGSSGGFHNIDTLPLGKLLKTKFRPGGHVKREFGKMGHVAKLRVKGFGAPGRKI